jgi:hypothetical protein
LNIHVNEDVKEVLPAVEMLLAQRDKSTEELTKTQFAMKWPTKLAVSYEQGLSSPKSLKSNNKQKGPKRGLYLSKAIKSPLNNIRINSSKEEFALNTRRLSSSNLAKTNKYVLF